MSGANRRPTLRPERRTRRPPRMRAAAHWLALILVAGASAIAVLAILPVSAQATTTFKVTPTFSGGKPGATSFNLRLVASDSAGGLPNAAWKVLIHLPKGTKLNLAGLPKRAVCAKDDARATYGASCPRESHAGGPGSVQLAALFGSKRDEGTATLHPVLDKFGFLLVGPAPAPFFRSEMTLYPFRDGGAYAAEGLLLSTETGGWVYEETGTGTNAATDTILSLSITVGGSVRRGSAKQPLIAMPGTCPRGGLFSWRTDVELPGGTDKTSTATKSRCP